MAYAGDSRLSDKGDMANFNCRCESHVFYFLNTWRLEVKSSQLQGTEPLTSRPQPSKQVLIAFACQLSHLVCYEERACQLWIFSISQEVKKGPFAALIMWFYLLTTKESLMGKV